MARKTKPITERIVIARGLGLPAQVVVGKHRHAIRYFAIAPPEGGVAILADAVDPVALLADLGKPVSLDKPAWDSSNAYFEPTTTKPLRDKLRTVFALPSTIDVGGVPTKVTWRIELRRSGVIALGIEATVVPPALTAGDGVRLAVEDGALLRIFDRAEHEGVTAARTERARQLAALRAVRPRMQRMFGTKRPRLVEPDDDGGPPYLVLSTVQLTLKKLLAAGAKLGGQLVYDRMDATERRARGVRLYMATSEAALAAELLCGELGKVDPRTLGAAMADFAAAGNRVIYLARDLLELVPTRANQTIANLAKHLRALASDETTAADVRRSLAAGTTWGLWWD